MTARRWMALAGVVLALSGCWRRAQTPEQKWEQELKAATGAHSMWYRFTFEAEYQGKPFKIDQMVNCTRSVVSGGSLGQSPDAVISEGHPMSAAARMADGSQVLVRIPNMCPRYRKFVKMKDGGWGTVPGWKSRGPHAVIPLVIWSDKMPKPDRIESYVAKDYYEQRDARIKNPRGFLDLWPVGQYPKNYVAVLKQENALTRYPNPFINPALNPNGRGKGRDGRFHGKGGSFSAYAIVPAVNDNDWIRKWAPVEEASDAHVLVPRDDVVLIKDTSKAFFLSPDPAFVHPRYFAYRLPQTGEYNPLSSEPKFVTVRCVSVAVANLQMGLPGMSDLPLDADDIGSEYPDLVREGVTGLNASVNALQRRELAGREQRMRNCYAQLGKLRSFDIINGRLDASHSLPGVIVYHRWIGEAETPGGEPPLSKDFLASGAYVPNGAIYRLRINGSNVDYALGGAKHDEILAPFFEDKKSREWLTIIGGDEVFFFGKQENSGY